MTDSPTVEMPASRPSPSTNSTPSPTGKTGRRWLPWVLGGVAVVVFVGLIGGAVFWSLSRKQSGAIDPAATRSAFSSAMRKAGVAATSPSSALELTTVRASGAHPFSATFSPDELAALLNTFVHSAPVSGSQISMRNVRMQLAGADSLQLSASVVVDGSTYSGVVNAPVAFTNGEVTSSGATAATAEGIPLNSGQRAQITRALVGYANAYLAAAPGLKITSAKVVTGGVAVTGIAPDRLTLP